MPSIDSTRPNHVVAKERQRKAFELRKAGVTLQRIGDEMGISRQAVHKLIKREMQELNKLNAQDAEELRCVELERLDVMILALWDKVRDGDVAAIKAAVDIGKRRASLQGLDAPVQTEVDLGITVSRAEIDEARRKVLKAAQAKVEELAKGGE